ncbi:MAG: hypothetical protein IKB82_05035 [Clostridia bacterium]|nr:hypothetical protein [Clostridia bacterium]
MNCINFDQKFEQYMGVWIKNHADEYKNNMDVIEGMMPEIYMEFLMRPATWLGGKAPQRFFEQYTDAKELVEWMCEYEKKKVPVPDLLLDRISEMGSAAQEPLMELLTRKKVPSSALMTAVSLLREIESVAPMQLYVDRIAALEAPDEKGDMYAESLLAMGEAAVEPMIAALETASSTGRDIFADILSNYPGDERIFDLLMERFKTCDDRIALFASYLAKFGDERALPALEKAAGDDEINYLDFIEVSSAIEALGGERPAEREFAGDPYYESLRQA